MVRKMSRRRRDLLNLLWECGLQSSATTAPLLGLY
jgi:hypothetical protein